MSVDAYAIKAVIPRSFPAPFPSSAIPGATSPRIISGITKLRKLPKIPFMVTKILVRKSGKKFEHIIPNMIAIIIFGSSPSLKLGFIEAGLIVVSIV